jgi:EAL domain-containing protein (putative c-di-GMP-specific phosphodiesterase class I)
VLFQYASRKGRVGDLEVACAAATLEAGAPLAQHAFLFLNVHPDAFANGKELRERIPRVCRDTGINPNRLVLEITEQGTLAAGPSLLETIDHLRGLGVRFAFDDIGVAYSHLPWIDKVRPSFLKVSQHFGTSFERDSAKTKIVANIQSLAQAFDCEVIVEGIEEKETAAAAIEMGIRYGQGFLFGRPDEAVMFL